MNDVINCPERAYKISRLLHWMCAIFFILLVISMPIMLDRASGSEERANVYVIHQSIATIFFILLMFRFVWMYLSKSSGTSIIFEFQWQYWMARLNHGILYLMMIVMPISGLISRIAGGKAIEIFNITLVPAIDSMYNKNVKFYAIETHTILINLFYVLIFFHIVGALTHILQSRYNDNIVDDILEAEMAAIQNAQQATNQAAEQAPKQSSEQELQQQTSKSETAQ